MGHYFAMDRGYPDYHRLHRIHLAGAFVVTRAKSNLDASRIYSHPADEQTGTHLGTGRSMCSGFEQG